MLSRRNWMTAVGAVATAACTAWNRPGQVEEFVAGSPVIEVVFADDSLLTS